MSLLGRMFLFAVACFLLALPVHAIKTIAPPTPKDIVGTWIGVVDDGLDFVRIDFRSEQNGYCAITPFSEGKLPQSEVDIYRISHWSLDGWKIVAHLTPIAHDSSEDDLSLSGRLDGGRLLEATIESKNDNWNKKVILYPEARIEKSNREAKEKINLTGKE